MEKAVRDAAVLLQREGQRAGADTFGVRRGLVERGLSALEGGGPQWGDSADCARALQALLKAAQEAAADAKAADAAAAAAAAEKAARLEGGGKSAGGGLFGRIKRTMGVKSSSVHPRKSCPICLEPLGTEGGIQALGCMDAFCRVCIATHIETQVGAQPTAAGGKAPSVACPICRREIPQEERDECGPGKALPKEEKKPAAPSVEEDAAMARALAAEDSQRRGRSNSGGGARGWLSGLAATAAHAPRALIATPSAMAAVAHGVMNATRGGRSNGGSGEYEGDEDDPYGLLDDDFVVYDDGSMEHFGYR